MKKLLGISLIAVMAVISPLMAGAAVTDADPGESVELAEAPKAENDPGYGLAQPNPSKDGNVATAGYVKGAYNAAIKAINKVAAQVDTIDTTLEDAATQDGVVETINNASATYTPQGSVSSVTIDTVNEWGTDGAGTITVPGGTFVGTEATINPTVNEYDDGED